MDIHWQDAKSVTSIGISWGYQAPPEDELQRARRVWEETPLDTGEPHAMETQTEASLEEEEADDEAAKGAAAMAPEDVLPSFAVKMNLTVDMMLFTERLQVVRDGVVCGTVTLSTDRMHNLPGTEEVYSSHVCGPDYSVMALVSAWTLRTSSERRRGPGEGSTFLTNSEGVLHVVARSSKDAEPMKWKISKEVSASLLGEGASLMLIRHLGVSRFVGSLSLFALLDGDGGLALQTLTSSRGSSDDVTQVVRQVRPMRRDLPDFSVECEVTRAGELLWYTRSPGEWWVRTDPRSRLYMTMRVGRALPPLHTRWREDAQLLTLYEERVELLRGQYGRRARELRPLLADFLLALLVAKPLNTFSFAVDYFTAHANVRPHEERACAECGSIEVGLQHVDALFYYEREMKRQEELEEEEASYLSGDRRDRKSMIAEGLTEEEEEPEPVSSEYRMARSLLAEELWHVVTGERQRQQRERRETQRVLDERLLRAALFSEAPFAEALVERAAEAAVDDVEGERRRLEDCTFRVHPLSILSDRSIINVYHDQRYGDDFEGPFHGDKCEHL